MLLASPVGKDLQAKKQKWFICLANIKTLNL